MLKQGTIIHYYQHRKDQTTRGAKIRECFILCHLFLPFNILDILVILVQTVTYLQTWFKNKWGCPQQ